MLLSYAVWHFGKNLLPGGDLVVASSDSLEANYCGVLVIKPTRSTNISNLFLGIKLYMFQTFPVSIIKSFSLYAEQRYMSYRFADSLRAVPSWSCPQAVNKSLWHIPLLCVQWKTADDGQRNCPKHVVVYSENKFVKLVHLVGFIGDCGSSVVKVLCYKSEGRWFDSRWRQWNFSLIKSYRLGSMQSVLICCAGVEQSDHKQIDCSSW